MEKIISYFDHPTARWFFVCSEKGLEMVTIDVLKGALEVSKQPETAKLHTKELQYMLDGNAVPYPLPLNVSGTALQQVVWQQIAQIPHGKTIDYTELAKRAGKPKAVRAVASACGKNPVPVAIPCHRVLRSDGSLGGFAFGLPLKQRMLEHEAVVHLKIAA